MSYDYALCKWTTMWGDQSNDHTKQMDNTQTNEIKQDLGFEISDKNSRRMAVNVVKELR